MTTGLEGPKRYVPEWQQVHVPDWAADLLNPETGPHDQPLRDGITGDITIEIEAITPLFVGARQTDVQGGGKRKHWLELGGKRAIAGTSVKGAIRAVIETATFGRFAERMDDRRTSIRDLTNPTDYIRHLSEIDRTDNSIIAKSLAGWLTPHRKGWRLQPCQWSLVKQTTLEDHHKKHIGRQKPLNLGRRQPAEQKYRNWGWGKLKVDFDPLPVSKDGDYADGRKLSRIRNFGTGRTKGQLVFTGQPNDRDGRRPGKGTEFIFHGQTGAEIEVARDVRRDFEFIHRNDDGTPNAEWGMWLKQVRSYNHRVPVFWLPDEDGGVKAMGLAMMFRLPYRKTLREAAEQSFSGAHRWDIADLLFGRVIEDRKSDDAKLDLRGRANFSHFVQADDTGLMDEERLVLLAPKYGFYPANVTQLYVQRGRPPKVSKSPPPGSRQPKPDYITLQHEEARLRGPSRYVASRSARPKDLRPLPHKGKENRDIVTHLSPVGKGARFRGKLRVFNLDPKELGALVWALHWGGGGEDPCVPSPRHAHMLGAAKSAGLGACRITIDTDNTRLATNNDPAGWDHDPNDLFTGVRTGNDAKAILTGAVNAFTAYMDTNLGTADKGWDETPQIQALMTMADLDHGDRMAADGQLTPLRTPRDFMDAKKEGLVLPLASGGYEAVKPPASRTAPTQPPRHQAPQTPKGPAPWAQGDRAWYAGEPVTLDETPRPGAATVAIVYDDGSPDTVPLAELTKR